MSHIGCTCEACREVAASARINSSTVLVRGFRLTAIEMGCPQAAKNIERYQAEIVAILTRP